MKVARTAPYPEELTVADGMTVLHRETVGLIYNALIGPDVAYIASWKEIATKVIDNLQQSEL